MKLSLKVEPHKITVTLQTSPAVKPHVIEMKTNEFHALLAVMQTAARADKFYFEYDELN